MKKICLLSDTHGYIDERILGYCASADEIWHAGDIGHSDVTEALSAIAPLRAVYGNIDGTELRGQFPEHQRFNCEGKDVWITHIGGYPTRYDRRVSAQIKADPPDLFICGHSHILKVMRDQKLGLLHMNPGAIGKHGFHQKRTMLRFAINKAKVKDLEVIEMPR